MRRACPGLLLLAAPVLAGCGGPEADGTANEVPIGIAPAPGVYPFQGVWAGEGASCKDAGLDLEDGPLVITTESVRYYDNPCAVEVVEELEPASRYALTMSCAGEGAPYDLTQRFAVSGDTLTVTDENGERAYSRCEASGANE